MISVAAPIRDVVGAVGGGDQRRRPLPSGSSRTSALAQATVESAALISRRLGYRGSIGAA